MKLFNVVTNDGVACGVNPLHFETIAPWSYSSDECTEIRFNSGLAIIVRENYTDFCVRLSEYVPDELLARANA